MTASASLLLVEDNTSDAYLMKRFLGENPEAPALVHVSDGEQALDYVFQRNAYHHAARPVAVILDLALPRVTGYDVLKFMKEDTTVADIPVIVLTTSRNPADQTTCQTLGAQGFFSKPNDLQGYRDLALKLLEPGVLSTF